VTGRVQDTPGASAAGAAEVPGDEFERVCRLEELELNRIRRVDIGGRELCLARTAAGLFAFGSVCPHQGGPMCEGVIKGTMTPSARNEYTFARAGEVVACPWHGYEFDLRTGMSVGGVVRGRVGAYPVELRGDDVYCSPRRLRPTRPGG
jgi:nitrite reductase/ring-hydroxylating ferredoxin subunit